MNEKTFEKLRHIAIVLLELAETMEKHNMPDLTDEELYRTYVSTFDNAFGKNNTNTIKNDVK